MALRKTALEELELSGFTVKKTDGEDTLDINSIALADNNDISSVDLRIGDQEETRESDYASLGSRMGDQTTARTSDYASLSSRAGDQTTARTSDYGSLSSRIEDQEAVSYTHLTLPTILRV